jgi:hypothetical protein
MIRTRLCSIIAAGGLAAGLLAATAPIADASPFTDGCTAVKGRPFSHALSSPKNGGNIEETCTFYSDLNQREYVVWNYYSTVPGGIPAPGQAPRG